jgi:hypothetical protein
MDPLKLLRALEEFLFEAIALLFFYPSTLLRIALRPLRTMDYAEAEEARELEDRYDDAVSPPLLLLLTILLANVIALAAHMPQPAAAGPLAKLIFDSPQNLLLFRSLIFSLLPLVAAITVLRRKHAAISRDALRPPFFAQCYLTVPFALALSIGGIGLQHPGRATSVAGGLLCAMGVAWMLWAQTRWFGQKLGYGPLRGFGTAVWILFQAVLYFLGVAVVIALS